MGLIPPDIEALARRTLEKTAQDVMHDAQEAYEDSQISGDELEGWFKKAIRAVSRGTAGLLDAWADLDGPAEAASDAAIYGGADKIVDWLIPGAGRLRISAEAILHPTGDKARRAAERKREKIPAAIAAGNTKKAERLEEKARDKDAVAAERDARASERG